MNPLSEYITEMGGWATINLQEAWLDSIPNVIIHHVSFSQWHRVHCSLLVRFLCGPRNTKLNWLQSHQTKGNGLVTQLKKGKE